MQGADSPFHDREVSRRQLLATTGTLAIGGTAALAAGTVPASASVELNIPDASRSGEDGSVADVVLDVTGAYQYEVNAATRVTLSLSVASGASADDWQAIDYIENSVATSSGAGQYELGGSVLSHPQYDAAEFSAEPEETNTVEVPTRVVMEVFDGEESVVSKAAETVTTVSVENTSIEATADLTGEGTVEVKL